MAAGGCRAGFSALLLQKGLLFALLRSSPGPDGLRYTSEFLWLSLLLAGGEKLRVNGTDPVYAPPFH